MPKASLFFGIMYCYSSVKRVKALYKNNGVKVASKSIFTKLKCASMLGFNIIAFVSIMKMISDNYDISLPESLSKLIK